MGTWYAECNAEAAGEVAAIVHKHGAWRVLAGVIKELENATSDIGSMDDPEELAEMESLLAILQDALSSRVDATARSVYRDALGTLLDCCLDQRQSGATSSKALDDAVAKAKAALGENA
jgi:hypothetical protein